MTDNTPYGQQPSDPGSAAPYPEYAPPAAYGAQPYRQSQSAGQPYGAPYGDPSMHASAASTADAQPRRKGLGLTAVILAAFAFVSGLALSIWLGLLIAPYALNPESMPEDFLMTLGFVGLGLLVPTLIGLAAIVFGIIAIVKKNGRGLGIAGLIVAVLAPIVCTIAMNLASVSGVI